VVVADTVLTMVVMLVPPFVGGRRCQRGRHSIGAAASATTAVVQQHISASSCRVIVVVIVGGVMTFRSTVLMSLGFHWSFKQF
jgi:hypothetical protein